MVRRHWNALAGAAACLVIATFPVMGKEVPLLDLFDLGIHELGHMLTIAFGRFIHTLAGSVFQVGVPLGLAGYFYLSRNDFVGAGFCLAWAGTSAFDVAVYVADAPFERLQLIGGYHDWAYLLGELDAIAAAGTVASAVRVVGAVLILAGVIVTLRHPIVDVVERRRRAALPTPTRVRAIRRWGPSDQASTTGTGSRHSSVSNKVPTTTKTTTPAPR